MPTCVGHSLSITSGPCAIQSILIMIHRMNGDAVQICLGDMTNPKDIIKIDPEDARRTVKLCKKHHKYLVVHGKFIYNFCHPNKISYQKALYLELLTASEISADVVIHQGKNVNSFDRYKAQQTYVDNIVSVINMMSSSNLNNRILLENSAHQGTEIGYSLNELHEIWQRFTSDQKKYLGFCIDTCHLFVAGELNVSDPVEVDLWFNKFDQLIGKEYLKLIHFNDSNREFNSHNDNHAAIGKGFIKPTGLMKVAEIAHKWSIPSIMETNPESMEEEISLVKSWFH